MARTHIGTSLITPLDADLAAGGKKITGLANATAAADAVAFGQLHVFQIVTATDTTPATTTSSSFQFTNSQLSITPSSASHKILILACGSAYVSNSTLTECFVSLDRAGTNIGGTAGFLDYKCATTTVNAFAPAAICFLDSPATTSARLYSVTIRSADGVSSVGWMRTGQAATLIALEVA